MSRTATPSDVNQTSTPLADRRPEPKRINVAVSKETVEALEMVIEREGVSLTEAVRRLVGYGNFIYRAIKIDNAEVVVKQGDNSRAVALL